MNLKLARIEYKDDGVFGVLESITPPSDLGSLATLEHSYDGLPKIPPGTYVCLRGRHRLHSMTEDFETFEILGVEGHSNLLFHWGNYNKDSEGCVLLGEARSDDMIVNSRSAFEQFMAAQVGVNSFTLSVVS